MRTSTAHIRGKDYLLCFSTRVSLHCEERNGSVQAQLEKTFNEAKSGKTAELFWLFYELLQAGAAYAQLENIPNPELMSFDELIDTIDLHDYSGLFGQVMAAVDSGTSQTIKTEPEKKRGRPKKSEQSGSSGTGSE